MDELLKNYLAPQQAPTLRMKSPVASAWSPTQPPADTEASPLELHGSSSSEDEPVTGRWELSSLVDPKSFVRDRAVLVRIDAEGGGRLLSLPASGAILGRSTHADVRVSEPGVSREHARIVFEYGSVFIQDMGSSNGTYVAGRRVERCELRDGDLLQLGPGATYRFSLMDSRQEDVFRRLYDTSVHDGLTRAHNRRYFDERLTAEVAFAKRHKTALSLILLDIDFFKGINDKYGHLAGDSVLRQVATVGIQTLRAEDVFARYGGEEFAIILRDIRLEGALRAAERIRSLIANTPFDVNGIQLGITLSAGCASSGAGRDSVDALISHADRCLYRAKRGGRNRVGSTP